MIIRFKFINRLNKHNRNTLYISINDGMSGSAGSVRKLISTPIDIDKKKWDKVNQRVKSSDPNHISLNQSIQELKQKINTAITEYERKRWNIHQVIDHLKGKSSFQTIDEYLNTIMQPKLKPTTYQSYLGVVKGIKKHLNISKDSGLKWGDLMGYSNIERFKINAEKNGLSGTSINSYFKQIQAIYRDAKNNNYNSDEFEIPKSLRPRNTRPKPLQTMTVQVFYDGIKNSKNLYDCQTLGLYLLMFACRGMYQADIVQMSFENTVFEGKPDAKSAFKLKHFRHKTKDSNSHLMLIDVSAIMLSLITMLKYSFMYTHSHLRPEVLAKYKDALAIFDYDVNDKTLHTGLWDFYGKNCKRLLGMPFKTARKTFNTVALELAIPDSIRRILLGHTDKSMLRNYDAVQAERIQKVVSDAHQKVLKNAYFETLCAQLLQKVESLNPKYVLFTHPNFNQDGIISEDHQAVLETHLPKIKDGLKIPRYRN